MLRFDTDKCTISAKSATGNYAEDIAGGFEKLNGFDIAFNSLYLIDAIKHFDSDDLYSAFCKNTLFSLHKRSAYCDSASGEQRYDWK